MSKGIALAGCRLQPVQHDHRPEPIVSSRIDPIVLVGVARPAGIVFQVAIKAGRSPSQLADHRRDVFDTNLVLCQEGSQRFRCSFSGGIPKLDATPLDQHALRDYAPPILRKNGINAECGVGAEAERNCQQLVDMITLE